MADEQIPDKKAYQLKIDAQVEKFTENKQKLTYFLITASVAVIAFLVNFTVDQLAFIRKFAGLVILACIAGFLTSACSLFNLHLENRSYRLHIKNRYMEKDYDSLSAKEQKQWDRINSWAAKCLNGAFVFLFFEIFFAVIFFVVVLYTGMPLKPAK